MTDEKRRLLRRCLKALLFITYNVFLALAIGHHLSGGGSFGSDIGWCDGLGFVLAATAVVYVCVVVSYGRRKLPPSAALTNARAKVVSAASNRYIKIAIYALCLIAIAVFIAVDTAGNRARAISASGIVAIIMLGALLSKHPKLAFYFYAGRAMKKKHFSLSRSIDWRQVVTGLILQYVFGLIVLR